MNALLPETKTPETKTPEATKPAPGSAPDLRQRANQATANQESVVRSAGVVSIAVLASRITGLVRESLMARLFGAGLIYDAFTLGFRIPNLTRDLFAEGALSSAFVPVFTEYLAKKSKQEAAALANLVGTAIILVVGTFCALGIVFSPALVMFLAPGFALVPGKFELAVRLTRIMFPFLLLVSLAAQAMGVLNACNRFGVPAMASTFFNIGSVIFGVALGYWAGPSLHIQPIEGMAAGAVLGGALQLAWQIPSLRAAGFVFRPAIDWSHPGLHRILAMMGPAIIGSSAVQINVMINSNFASSVSDPVRGLDGPVAWLGYAFRLMQLPIGLFGVAMATAALPSLSRSAGAGNLDEIRRTVSKALSMVFLVTIPASVGLWILGKSIIGTIYQAGGFNAYDTNRTATALSCYAVGLFGYAAVKILNPAFYALGNARVPMIVSLFSIAINFIMVWTLTHAVGMGIAGLALATSAVALFNFIALFVILRSRLGGIYGRDLARSFAKVASASAVMGAAIWASTTWMSSQFGDTQLARLGDLAVSMPIGLGVFYGGCRVLGVGELDMAIRAFTAPVKRRLST